MILYTHTDSENRVEIDLELDATIDPGQDGGRWDPSWPAYVEECSFRVLGVRLLNARGEVENALCVEGGTLPPGAAEALAREFTGRYCREHDLKRQVDAHVMRMEEICPA